MTSEGLLFSIVMLLAIIIVWGGFRLSNIEEILRKILKAQGASDD